MLKWGDPTTPSLSLSLSVPLCSSACFFLFLFPQSSDFLFLNRCPVVHVVKVRTNNFSLLSPYLLIFRNFFFSLKPFAPHICRLLLVSVFASYFFFSLISTQPCPAPNLHSHHLSLILPLSLFYPISPSSPAVAEDDKPPSTHPPYSPRCPGCPAQELQCGGSGGGG